MKVRAAVLHEMGRPTPYARSRPVEVEELTLADPGPGEVLVRVTAAGLCHSDLSVVDGSRPRPVPMVLGHEATGVVEAVGDGVGYVRPGDHVVFTFVPMCGACVPCQSGRPALCEAGARANVEGALLSGGRPFSRPDGQRLSQHLGVSAFAEYTVVSVASVVRVPDEIPAETAALFGCALLTGVGAVVNTAAVPPGSSVAVFGLGGVGLSAVMGARLAGAYPIVAVDRIAEKLEQATQLGASHVLLSDDDTEASIRELTHGGAEFTFEAVGNSAVLRSAYLATRRGGATVSVGLPHPSQELRLPAVSIVAEERRILGSYMGSGVPRRDVPRLMELYLAGQLPVDRLRSGTITLDDLNTACDALAAGRTVRQVLTLDTPT
ncbi:MAG: zinc-dependent alcohol dehydrogenase family protein [Actinocatenispora sp.]